MVSATRVVPVPEVGFPVFNRWWPPARPDEIVPFELLDAMVLLDGDGTPSGHGYHRHGLGIKPDEFRGGWDAPDVMMLVESILTHPVDGLPGRRPDSFSLLGIYLEVTAVMRLRRDGHGGRWRIATVHPFDRVRWERERDRLG